MSCAGCEDCGFRGIAGNQEPIYQIHVSVAPTTWGKFSEVCAGIRLHSIYGDSEIVTVKPLMIQDSLNPSTERTTWMTTSIVRGSLETAKSFMESISAKLRDTKVGLRVVRKKIETVPWHPLATTPAEGQYFEAHLAVKTASDEKILKLRTGLLTSTYGAYVSRNFHNGAKTMLTVRHAQQSVVRTRMHQVTESLHRSKMELAEKPIVEFTIFDSNVDYDKDWIK